MQLDAPRPERWVAMSKVLVLFPAPPLGFATATTGISVFSRSFSQIIKINR